MSKITYTGASHERIVEPEDFEAAGLAGQERLFIDVRVNRDAEVSDEAAQLLKKLEPTEWAIEGEGPVEVEYTTDATSPAPAAPPDDKAAADQTATSGRKVKDAPQA